jgi:hypothetical protein
MINYLDFRLLAESSRMGGKKGGYTRVPAMKAVLASYMVRVYRFGKNQPHNLVGVVEEAGVKGKKAFTSLSELWSIINSSRAVRNDRKTERKKFYTRNDSSIRRFLAMRRSNLKLPIQRTPRDFFFPFGAFLFRSS